MSEAVINRPASTKVKVQKFGAFLSGMVMPNIGAFIAWGLLTAFFIPQGWTPNATLNKLVSPTLTYVMPLLLGYTGGKMVHGHRGGVAGVLATIGVVVGASVTMLIGGMVMGPLGGWVLKKFDGLIEGKVKPGMEMLVDNFSMGIIGGILMIIGYIAVEPILQGLIVILSGGVSFLIHHSLLPLVSIFVAPAQVLFLNNVVNHGIMVPIGVAQAAATGKSILFLVEANGSIWTGVALAFALFGSKVEKKSAPAAVVIMGFGGIAEVVFPYVLSKPRTIVGPIIGNMTALFTLSLMGGGTVAAVSPGSIFALIAMTPKGGFAANLTGYAVGLVVTTLATGFMLRTYKSRDDLYDEEAVPAEGIAAKADSVAVRKTTDIRELAVPAGTIRHIYFACDAGMGSSVMGVSIMKTKINKAMLDIAVDHVSVKDIPEEADLIVTTKSLEARVKDTISKYNRKIPVFGVTNLLDNANYDELITYIKQHT